MVVHPQSVEYVSAEKRPGSHEFRPPLNYTDVNFVQEQPTVVLGKNDERRLAKALARAAYSKEVLPSTKLSKINAQPNRIERHEDRLVRPGVHDERNTTPNLQSWEDHLSFQIRPPAGIPEPSTEHRLQRIIVR